MVNCPKECNMVQWLLMMTNELVIIESEMLNTSNGDSEPSCAEAKRCPDWPKWEDAIQKELNRLENSGTYRLVKQPPDTNIVNLKWVFRIKLNAAGEVDKYKARLVARGFTQIYGIDYYKTQDLVEKMISLSQQVYIKAIITKFNFDNLKACSTPMDPSALLSKSQSPTKLEDIAKMRNIPYQEAVGSLMYMAMGTRPAPPVTDCFKIAKTALPFALCER